MKSKKKSFHFEDGIEQLSDIIDEMESGDLSLEESLEKFEQGINLTRQCQQALKAAEQKVKILQQKQNEESLEDFNSEEIDD